MRTIPTRRLGLLLPFVALFVSSCATAPPAVHTETVVVHDPVQAPLAPELTQPAAIPLLPPGQFTNGQLANTLIEAYSALGIDTCKLYRISALQPKSTTVVPAWCSK